MPTPDINLNPASLDSGVVTVGDSTSLTAQIENLGNADLTVNDITLSAGTGAEFTFSTPATPFTIPVGGSQDCERHLRTWGCRHGHRWTGDRKRRSRRVLCNP